MDNLIANGGLVAIVIALNALLGKYIDSKWLPLSSVILGIGGSFLMGGISVEIGIAGLVIGLSACGLYDQKKLLSK